MGARKIGCRVRLILGGVGVGLGSGLLLLLFSRLPSGTALELRSLDLLFLLRGSMAPPKSIVIVGLDEEHPPAPHLRWPWPRRYYARLTDRLRAADAKVIAFDLIFDQPSSPEDDTLFVRAMRRAGNVVLASDLAFREAGQAREIYPIDPLPIFKAAAKAVGVVTIPIDPDQRLRSARFSSLQHPTFAVQVVRTALPQETVRLTADGDRLFVGDKETPVVRPGQILVNYVGPTQTVTTVPFSEVMAMDAARAQETFRNQIVLIGRAPTSIISLRKLTPDTFATPFFTGSKTYLAGVEVHANIVATILEQRFIAPISGTPRALVFLGWGAILGLALVGLPPLLGGLIGLAVSPIPLSAACYLFSRCGFWLPWAALTLQVVVVYGGVLLIRYFVSERDLDFLRQAFQHYVHPAIIAKIMANPDELKLGGDLIYGTVLFADLKGFTTFSERLSPERLVTFLNEYLTAATDIIVGHEGTLNRYIGDAIMAIWGAPLPITDHARLACQAALQLREELIKRNPEWRAKGLPVFHVRIGVHTGPMIVGNVGSRKRFDYTAMGDTVNLASRLEGLCKVYGVSILISETTRGEAGIFAREMDMVRVVGREAPVRIFEPLTPAANLEVARRFEEALAAYRSRAFAQAIDRFDQVLRLVPDDKATRLFRDRCQLMVQEPPSKEWDGIFEPGVK